LPPLGSG
jgi:hypothetical protein